MPVNSGPAQQPEDDELGARPLAQLIDQHIHAHMDAGADSIGRTEFGHPHEHDDAQLLGPTEVEPEQEILYAGNRKTGEHSDGERR